MANIAPAASTPSPRVSEGPPAGAKGHDGRAKHETEAKAQGHLTENGVGAMALFFDGSIDGFRFKNSDPVDFAPPS